MDLLFFLFTLFTNTNDPPPGSVKVGRFYVDQTEMGNIHWLEFLYYNEYSFDSVTLKKCLPVNSEIWLWYPAKRFEPIVSISHDAVLLYCKWRSAKVSEITGRKITYRLPTPAEWQEIAQTIFNTDSVAITKEFAKSKKLLKRYKNQYFMFAENPVEGQTIKHFFDNVSEMTNEPGIAMGASNLILNSIQQSLNTRIKYDRPDNYLGFRCIAEEDK